MQTMSATVIHVFGAVIFLGTKVLKSRLPAKMTVAVLWKMYITWCPQLPAGAQPAPPPVVVGLAWRRATRRLANLLTR